MILHALKLDLGYALYDSRSLCAQHRHDSSFYSAEVYLGWKSIPMVSLQTELEGS